MQSIIVQVIVDNTFPDSIVLSWIFNYMLLEESMESQDLSVMLEPLRWCLWDGLIDNSISLWHSCQLQRLSSLHLV